MNKKQLWMAIKGYHFNDLAPEHLWDKITETFGGVDASTKAFASKIARKLNWEKSFALKAVMEYKKFVYLAVASDFHVTPSKVIDQVWHEHLLFTKAYRTFCKDVICYNLDHNPELIPVTEETGIFNAQYVETIELYKTEFSMDPPDEIWGTKKFKMETSSASEYQSKKKQKNSFASNTEDNSSPLYLFFDTHQHQSYPEFAGYGGGEFGGAGAGGSFENHSHETHISEHSVNSEVSTHDSVAVDSGHSSCSSSSCSSSCGGGGD